MRLLPSSLLLLLSTVLGQQTTQLSLDQLFDSSVNASSSPSVFNIPSSSSFLSLSVSLCTNQLPYPRFILSNDTSSGIPTLNDTGGTTFEIALEEGLGVWTGFVTKGGVLAVYPGNTSPGVVYPPWLFQVAVSDKGLVLYLYTVKHDERF